MILTIGEKITAEPGFYVLITVGFTSDNVGVMYVGPFENVTPEKYMLKELIDVLDEIKISDDYDYGINVVDVVPRIKCWLIEESDECLSPGSIGERIRFKWLQDPGTGTDAYLLDYIVRYVDDNNEEFNIKITPEPGDVMYANHPPKRNKNTPLKYRLKTSDVEAIQWTGQNTKDIQDFIGDPAKFSIIDNVWKDAPDSSDIRAIIETYNGDIVALVRDYIVKYPDGKISVYCPVAFEDAYKSID